MDDSSEDLAQTAVGAVIAALVIICVALRFYARHYTRSGFKTDDWLILLSLLLVIVTDAIVLYASGLAPNVAYIASTPGIEFTPAAELYTKIDYIGTVLFFLITSSTKLSILLLYNRIFSVDGLLKRQIIALIIAVAGYGIGTTVANLLNCIPLKYSWINNLDDPRYCFNYNNFWLATGIVEAVLDVLILLLPIGAVSKLQLNVRKRFAISLVFLTGAFSIASGILKAYYGFIPNSRVPSFGNTSIWATVHLGTGIICACLPPAWPVFVLLWNFKKWSWVQSISSRKDANSTSGGWSELRERGSGRNMRQPPSAEEGLPATSEGEYPSARVHQKV
ncbi:hypothetical protein F5Y16DRAFT_417344 [Xylariaceae sp. FL0255]|nr:hypothetical protein F5Y16DRAFT_417344 [Xylariaceae sp. FL0255]